MVNEYWKARLNDDEKACYETILGGAKAVADSVQCLRTHVSSVEKAYFAVVEDHPELFYMSNQYNCKYYRTGKGANEYDDVTVLLEYVYSDAEINEYRVTVNNRIKEFRRMTVGMTTQQKVISSVEYLIDIISINKTRLEYNISFGYIIQILEF